MVDARRLYHFVNCKYGIEDILKQRIKVSRIEDSNDPFELLPCEFGKAGIPSAFEDIKNSIDDKHGYLCFSTEWSNPVMWSHYADKHRGICLGFDFKDEGDIPSGFVDYLPNRIRYEDGIHSQMPAFLNALLWSKYEHWAYENEFRFLVLLENIIKENKFFFFPFGNGILSLKEIILGSRNKLPINFNVKPLTSGNIRIIETGLSDTEFRVVAKASCNVNFDDIKPLFESIPLD